MTLADMPDASPRAGIAPDSWGVWNAVDAAQPGPDQYLREVQEAGFHFTEIGPYGYLGTDHHEVADKIAAHDLSVSGGTVFTGLHRGASELETAWPAVAAVAGLVKSLGADHLLVIPELWERGADGAVVGRRTFGDDEWDAFTAGHDELGRRLLEEFGLHQQFHSHAESPVGSRFEIVRLLENTDPAYTNLCLDTGHFAYYAGDNVRLMTDFPDRIGYLHLKQVEPDLLAHVLKNDISFVEAVGDGVMVEPPFGVPDYRSVLEAAAAANPGVFAIVEQDMYPVGDFALPLQIARRTIAYIRDCGAPVRFR